MSEKKISYSNLKDEEISKIESVAKKLLLKEEEYKLKITLYSNDQIEFKVILNSPLASCYYMQKYDFESIKIISHIQKDNMNDVYQHYKNRIIPRKEFHLTCSEDKNKMYL